MTEIEFAVGTMNIPAAKGQKGDLSRKLTRDCLVQIQDEAGITGLQEMIEPEDNDDIDFVLNPRAWYHFAATTENDIVVRRSRFRPASSAELEKAGLTVGEGTILLHKGFAGVSPHRVLTWVALVFVNAPELGPFIFANTHFVSGVKPGRSELEWRKAARARSMSLIRSQLEIWVGRGLNVILTGDFNWLDMPTPSPSFHWTVPNNSIDKIGFANAPEASWELQFVSAERFKNPSDHDFRVANLKAIAKAVPEPEPTLESDLLAWAEDQGASDNAVVDLKGILQRWGTMSK